jgi:hypothetical protein
MSVCLRGAEHALMCSNCKYRYSVPVRAATIALADLVAALLELPQGGLNLDRRPARSRNSGAADRRDTAAFHAKSVLGPGLVGATLRPARGPTLLECLGPGSASRLGRKTRRSLSAILGWRAGGRSAHSRSGRPPWRGATASASSVSTPHALQTTRSIASAEVTSISSFRPSSGRTPPRSSRTSIATKVRTILLCHQPKTPYGPWGRLPRASHGWLPRCNRIRPLGTTCRSLTKSGRMAWQAARRVGTVRAVAV